MKKSISGLFLGLVLISCARERTNPYDVLNDSFTPPAPLQWCDGNPVYDTTTGNLVGVVITLAFCEPFPKTMGITHIFYSDDSPLDSAGFVINIGTQVWQVGIFTSYQFPIGNYRLKLFFGGFPIAGFPFQVVEADGRSVFKGVARTPPEVTDLEDRVFNIQF